MSATELPHICFVSDRLQHYLDESDRTAGGAQRQQYLLAQALLERGHDVSAIVGDYGQPRVIQQKGVRTVSGCPKEISSPAELVRAIYTLERSIRRADADVYYVRGAPRLFIATRLLTRLHRTPLVFCLANDSDLDPNYLVSRYGPWLARLYWHVLPTADAIVTQTERQHDDLRAERGVDSIVIPNAYTLPPSDEVLDHDRREHVLWVGSSDPQQKKPERYLRLARALPDVEFVMLSQDIGNTTYHHELASKAESIANLRFLENVPPDDVHKYYRTATSLVNTSDYEGFPNTFLEAWRYATPVVSLYYALDDVLEKQEVGVRSGSMDALVEDVADLHENQRRRDRLGTWGRELIEREYSIRSSVENYQRVFNRV